MKNLLYILRKEKGLTQNVLADYLKMDRRNYNKLENLPMNKISSERIKNLAKFYNVSIDYLLNDGDENSNKHTIRIPVLGCIPAGIPVEAIEDIIDYEEISENLMGKGEFFGLQVKGNSMSPRIQDKDVVIIKKQDTAENGDICAVLVNGFEATLKQVKLTEKGLTLIPFNPDFSPISYSNEEIERLPVRIIGKVIELRAKF